MPEPGATRVVDELVWTDSMLIEHAVRTTFVWRDGEWQVAGREWLR